MAPDPIGRRRLVEDTRFDTVARSLARASASASSRRRALGGMLGATVAVLTGSYALADRPRNRRGRRGSHGQSETAAASDVLPEGVLAGGVLEETIEMCHHDPETGGYRIVLVSPVAVPEQLARGNTLYIDCCVSTDCSSTECLTAKGCASGACSFDVALNAPCTLENGAQGICRSDAACVPVSA
jgi:hypothetical protein